MYTDLETLVSSDRHSKWHDYQLNNIECFPISVFCAHTAICFDVSNLKIRNTFLGVATAAFSCHKNRTANLFISDGIFLLKSGESINFISLV